MRASPRCLALFAFFMLSIVAGCAPLTPYRYTALVPPVRPIAWDGRAARDGSLRIEGNVARADVVENLAPQLHDTALLVPRVTMGGAVTLTVTPGFEFGVRGTYAAYAWNEASAIGTQPLPSAPSLFGIGPEVRGSIPFGKEKRFALGIAANALYFQVPYAAWELTGPNSPTGLAACAPSPTCVNGYSLMNENTETHWAVSLGLYPSYAFGDGGKFGRVFFMAGLHTAFQNDGFSNAAQSGSTIQEYMAGVVGGGYGAQIDILHVSAMLFQPIAGGTSKVDYGFGGLVTVGVDLALWKSKAERRAEERRLHPERFAPTPPPEPPPPNQPEAPAPEIFIGPEGA